MCFSKASKFFNLSVILPTFAFCASTKMGEVEVVCYTAKRKLLKPSTTTTESQIEQDSRWGTFKSPVCPLFDLFFIEQKTWCLKLSIFQLN